MPFLNAEIYSECSSLVHYEQCTRFMQVIKDFCNLKFPFRRIIDLNSGMQCGWVRVEAGTHATFIAEKDIHAHILKHKQNVRSLWNVTEWNKNKCYFAIHVLINYFYFSYLHTSRIFVFFSNQPSTLRAELQFVCSILILENEQVNAINKMCDTSLFFAQYSNVQMMDFLPQGIL